MIIGKGWNELMDIAEITANIWPCFSYACNAHAALRPKPRYERKEQRGWAKTKPFDIFDVCTWENSQKHDESDKTVPQRRGDAAYVIGQVREE